MMLKGEFVRALTLTDARIGWVFTGTVRNNANVHILGATTAGVEEIPFEVTELDFGDGSEPLNHFGTPQSCGHHLGRGPEDLFREVAAYDTPQTHPGRQIAELQAPLLKLAKDKNEQFYLASCPTALGDIRKGSRVKASRTVTDVASILN
ncbi:MAG: hypothetical protein ACOYNM_19055 [Gemmataceae bacterium]